MRRKKLATTQQMVFLVLSMKMLRKKRSMDLLLKTLLQAKPNKGPSTVDAFPHKSFRDLFLRFNTQILSCAAVERMFSMGKDILKPKRSKMSD